MPPSPINQAAQRCKQFRYAMDFVQDDEPILVISQKKGGIGEFRAVFADLEIQVNGECFLSDGMSQGGLTDLPRTHQSHQLGGKVLDGPSPALVKGSFLQIVHGVENCKIGHQTSPRTNLASHANLRFPPVREATVLHTYPLKELNLVASLLTRDART